MNDAISTTAVIIVLLVLFPTIRDKFGKPSHQEKMVWFTALVSATASMLTMLTIYCIKL